MKTFAKKALQIALPVVLLAFLLKTIISNWSEALPYFNNLGYFSLLLSFLTLLLIYPESAFGWFVLVNKLGTKISLKNAMYVWIVSNTSRYIPGTIWQYIGRVELAERFGVPRKEGIVSVLCETLLIIIAGCMVSAFAISQWETLSLKPYIVLAGMLIPIALLHPVLSNKTLELLAKVTKKEKVSVNPPKLKDYVVLLPLFVFNFLLNGIGLMFLVYSFTGKLENIFLLSGIYALSWLVGYFSIFAPGGLGVTEASLALLLSFQMPLPLASSIAIIYRFLLVIAELITFTIALKFRK